MSVQNSTSLGPPPLQTPLTAHGPDEIGIPWQNRQAQGGVVSSNLNVGWAAWFSRLAQWFTGLINQNAIPKVGPGGAFVESGITDNGTSVKITTEKLGIGGAGAALYDLDIRVGALLSGIHLCNSDADRGTYVFSDATDTYIINNATFVAGTGWVAKDTIATILSIGTTGLHFFCNTGLVAGNTFSPTQIFSISTAGAVIATGDVTGNSITLSSRVTHGAPLTGTANLGTGAVTGTVT